MHLVNQAMEQIHQPKAVFMMSIAIRVSRIPMPASKSGGMELNVFLKLYGTSCFYRHLAGMIRVLYRASRCIPQS